MYSFSQKHQRLEEIKNIPASLQYLHDTSERNSAKTSDLMSKVTLLKGTF